MDGLRDFLDLLRNDRTRIAIRGFVIIGGVYQILILLNRPLTNIVPQWAIEIISFFTMIFGLFVGSYIALGLVLWLLGSLILTPIFKIRPLKNQKVGVVHVLLSLIISSILIFQFESPARLFSVVGLVGYLIYDIFIQGSPKKDTNSSPNDGHQTRT